MPDAVIFDFDGVLFDTEPLHFHAFNHVLAPWKLDFDWTTYRRRFMGYDDRDAFRAAFMDHDPPLTKALLNDLVRDKAAIFPRLALEKTLDPYPGAADLISALRFAGVPLAICSGALRSDIDTIFNANGWDRFFPIVVSAENTAQSKPDPAPYLLTLDLLRRDVTGLHADRCIVVEDTPAGIAAAAGAGCHVLAVTHTHDQDALRQAGHIVDSLADVTIAFMEQVCMA